MGGKNTPCGTACCCNNCENRLPTALRCCCHCICDSICVTVSIPSDADCDCDEATGEFFYSCVTDSWAGTIVCNDLSIDLEFSVKTCDDKCYICLESYCLGMDGTCPTDCKVFTPAKTWCRGDYTGIVRTGGLEAAWTGIDFSDCGDAYCGTGTITIGCSERIFPSCSRDCAEPLCTGCDCVCRCICINFIDINAGTGCKGAQAVVCWDAVAENWTTTINCPSAAIEVTITITKNATTGLCELTLSQSLVGTDPDPVALDGCPDISATWNILDGSEVIAVITASCQNCGDCTGAVVCASCPDNFIPRILTGTVEDVLGGCGNLNDKQYQLVNVGTTIDDDCWEGDGPTETGCSGGPSCDEKLSMRCNGDGTFTLYEGILDCGAGAADSNTATPISCDPFEILFDGITLACCCPGATTVDIRVTE